MMLNIQLSMVPYVILHQFAYSHFNEKVRWALDYKGVPHTRETYLPGPHIPAIRRMSGQPQTPVLQIDDRYVAGSAHIIDALELAYPAPALYPADEDARREALALQQEFDLVVGPAVRTVLFSELIKHAGYLCDMFAGAKSLPKRMAYRATFPLARPLIARGNGVNDENNVANAFEITARTLDRVAEQSSQSGYLTAGTFSIADLAAAALLAPIANVQHPDMRRPQPMPSSVAALVARYATHPAIEWVNRVYNQHR
jgi:glutathione S-transferase